MNKRAEKLAQLNPVGCASHRFNLGVQDVLADHNFFGSLSKADGHPMDSTCCIEASKMT